MMKSVDKLLRYVTDSSYRFEINNSKGLYNDMPDDKYLKLLYKKRMGKELNLENPQTFNEKMQWLKLYDRKPEYTKMVDKYLAKEFVAQKIGNDYIIKNIGVWDDVDKIDYTKLPNRFVIKCTHNSGDVFVCRDKSTFDFEKIKGEVKKNLDRNFFYHSREWPYKNVKPRVIIEEYMEDENNRELTDYKFFCFNGEPHFIYVSTGLENHETASISFLTMDWNFAKYERRDFKPYAKIPKKPNNFETMIEICKELSKEIPFVRVDLYEINNKIYFSELTFFPCSGMIPFKNMEHDLEIGRLLVLPKGNCNCE